MGGDVNLIDGSGRSKSSMKERCTLKRTGKPWNWGYVTKVSKGVSSNVGAAGFKTYFTTQGCRADVLEAPREAALVL